MTGMPVNQCSALLTFQVCCSGAAPSLAVRIGSALNMDPQVRGKSSNDCVICMHEQRAPCFAESYCYSLCHFQVLQLMNVLYVL